MRVYNNILETIGNTPIVKLNKLKKKLDLKGDIYVKLESFNPLSSIKDRTAYALINDLIAKNKIKKDTVIVEATSGNTGIGLAFICLYLEIPLKIVMPETMSEERKKLIRSLGAELILTDGSKGMTGAINKQKELLKENKNYLEVGQFTNQANPKYHYDVTAEEIIKTIDNIDYFVAGVGTGGTISGIGQKLKEKNKNTRIIAVEPAKSAVLHSEKPNPHKIQGIGAGFIPSILDMSIIDDIYDIEDEEAFFIARLLLKEEGIFAGISSGAALAAAIKIARSEENINKQIVVILPDTGERYLSMDVYNV